MPAAEPPDHYVYDPADPFMSLMGEDSQNLPVDQSPADHRRDNLVFRSAPLDSDLTIVGYPIIELWVSSDAPDTDFAVRLIEVGADGLAINLSQGIVRARYREGYDREVMLEPGRPTLLEIRLQPVGIRLQRGSRIRIDVASSDFPAFDRNHNTGGRDWQDTDLQVARQTVFHDAEHPSCIVLPLLPS
jgi:putative CocE/NonD family hydrolase